jgi:hypothetical protein
MGSLAGGIGAAITTPLDVCKTRIMLSSKVWQYTVDLLHNQLIYFYNVDWGWR